MAGLLRPGRGLCGGLRAGPPPCSPPCVPAQEPQEPAQRPCPGPAVSGHPEIELEEPKIASAWVKRAQEASERRPHIASQPISICSGHDLLLLLLLLLLLQEAQGLLASSREKQALALHTLPAFHLVFDFISFHFIFGVVTPDYAILKTPHSGGPHHTAL